MTVEIETTATRIVYENRWMRVREDAIRRQDGSTGIYGVVEKADFAVIVAIEPDGSMYLVQQYRYPVGARFWELPQGSWETRPDMDPAELARGELREETGLSAEKMTHVAHLFEAYGYATQGFHIFLARGLLPGVVDLDQEEQGLISRRFSQAEVIAMIARGEIKDAVTVGALGYLALTGQLGG